MMCHVLKVSRSGFYKWQVRKPSERTVQNESLQARLMRIARKEEGIPGYRKLWGALRDEGINCSQNRVQRLLQALGYRASSAMKPGHRKADSGLMVLPNLLNREFSAQQKNQRWVSDITQIQCVEGWLYVAVVLDLYSRKVVGWASSHINNAELVSKALRQAWQARQPQGSDLLFHSDQGSQYRSEAVLSWLNRRGVTISMSRRGNCWDNACMESFFAQMKKEWTSHKGEIKRTAMYEQVHWYIDRYYNRIRRHGALNGLSPMVFESQAI
jgi:putative transposase